MEWSIGQGNRQHPRSAKSWFILLKRGFQSRFVSQYSAAIAATLRKAEDAPFVINYTPVGHSCDFGCLFDHLRKQPAFSCTSLSLVPCLPNKSRLFRSRCPWQQSSSFLLSAGLPVAPLVCCAPNHMGLWPNGCSVSKLCLPDRKTPRASIRTRGMLV